MKNYGLTPHKLEDQIVVDGILAINTLKTARAIAGHIVGGMAVSSYLPVEDHRTTVDLDFFVLWGGASRAYRSLVEPLRTALENEGYSIRYKKSGLTHDLITVRGGDSFVLQHRRISTPNLERNLKSFEREVANHRTVSNEGLSYDVLSPEDLIAHKTSRVVKYRDYYGISLPGCIPLDALKEIIDDMRANVLALKDSVSPEEVARLRLFYDTYDIRKLASKTGINREYFEEVLRDWTRKSSDETKFRRLLDGFEIKVD
jgi:hypothetical protein